MPILKDVELAQSALQRYLAAATDAQRHQIYPEIWRSLDSALAEARTEGKDTSRIDAVRARLGAAALEHPPPPDESGIEGARQAFAWFNTHYAALQFGGNEAVPDLGPSKLKKTMVYGIAGVILVLCAIGYIIARIGMRAH
ncbi:MAG: hypothetical protein H0T46_17635 [Deltaproteobacteria bacterium]|nr:hypothetical protein [Deltaproteobacteria bacterium]